jgi:hypothetical protein
MMVAPALTLLAWRQHEIDMAIDDDRTKSSVEF